MAINTGDRFIDEYDNEYLVKSNDEHKQYPISVFKDGGGIKVNDYAIGYFEEIVEGYQDEEFRQPIFISDDMDYVFIKEYIPVK